MTYISQYLDAFLMMLAEMAPYLMLGFFFAGLLRTFVPKSIYRRHLSKPTMGSVVKAAALGIPLPLCSCGVIPTSVELRREGASHGACVSFLIATPQTGVDSIAATYSLMGLPFAVVRPFAALFTALFGGWMVNRYAKSDEAISEHAAHHEEVGCSCHDHDDCHDHCDCHDHDEDEGHKSLWHRFWDSMHYAFVEMLQDVGKWLVIGLLIAALITVAVPNEWLAALHDYKLLNMLLVLCVAIPMYVCATGSIPIAVSLLAKGLTPGAALVLLMAGPAVNSASILVIGKVFGKRTLLLYLLSIVIGAVVFGLGIDYLLPQDWFAVSGFASQTESCTHCLDWTDWMFMGVFFLLLINAFARQMIHSRAIHHKHHTHEQNEEHQNITDKYMEKELQMTVYTVKGMSCNHCKASVEKAISEVDGVENVEVDLASGKTLVYGAHIKEKVMKAVTDLGFEID